MAVAGVVVLAVPASCSSEGEPSASPSGPSSSVSPASSSPTDEPTPEGSPGATPEAGPEVGPEVGPEAGSTPRSLTLAVAGDVHFEGVLRQRLDDPTTALAPVTATLAAADVAVVNLETSVGTGGRPDPAKRFTFRAPPSAFAALAAAGIDVATMANNHALDFGRDPLPGTFAAIADAKAADPPLDVVGIGRDLDAAYRPALVDVDGSIVAVLGATVADTDPTADPTGQWAATDDSPGTADAVDPARLLRAVEQANGSADVVVVYMHWGIQGQRCPDERQRSLAAALVRAGADVVVGSHTHRLQGAGRLGEGYVAYGLGNYAWYTQASEATTVTGVLTLSVRLAPSRDGRATVTDAAWESARIGADGLPTVTSGPAAEAFDADLVALRGCAGLGE